MEILDGTKLTQCSAQSTSTLHFPEEDGRFLEIFGYDSFPDGVKDALMQAEYISLVDNQFIKSLSDLVAKETMNVGNVMAMKCCRLERCAKMKEIFCGEETELPENLEILQVKFCDKLKRLIVADASAKFASQKLHTLHLVELPELESIAVPHQH
ncbi:putative disease resistance protein [Quercus suber]|uniref:Disease resistance protein n=1 Tax=Quercus suber TaxID=58331 RepID=A0AAW0JBF8_QUESU